MEYPLIGHKHIIDFFDRSIAANRVSHAYCFVGPEHAGKRRVAAEVSALLFQKPYEQLSRIPDYRVIQKIRDEKTGKTKKHISVEQMKDVAVFLNQRPFISSKKIVVIDHAHHMSASAANALLKTLEEPPAYAHIFLITPDDAQLPATILSRCQTVYFQVVPKVDITDMLVPSVRDSAVADEMARISLGLPGRVMGWLNHPELYEEHKREVERFHGLFEKTLHEKIIAVEGLFGDKSDHIATRDTIRTVFSLWQLVIRDEVYRALGMERDRTHHIDGKHGAISLARAEEIYTRIETAKKRIEENIHPRLLVEHILLALP